MKYIPNPLYIILLIVLVFILQFSWSYKHQTYTFYGFAQNKETEINYEHTLLINQVLTKEGQEVNKGDTLLIATRHQEIDQVEINDARADRDAIQQKEANRKMEIRAAIRQLKAEKRSKAAEIETDIRTLQAELDLNQKILAEIQSVDLSEMDVNQSPIAAEIKAKRNELQLVNMPIDAEIAGLEEELNTPSSAQILMDKLSREASIHQKEFDKVIITAPTNGLIGNMHFKEGENADDFETLVSFYERKPKLVIGYVHENLIVHVNVGDSIEVISSYYPENKVNGKVIGLGTRIVEIPPRLRKIPEMKTYGREVMIQLPSDNDFLQKEKVILNLLNTQGIPANLQQSGKPSSSIKEKDIQKMLDR